MAALPATELHDWGRPRWKAMTLAGRWLGGLEHLPGGRHPDAVYCEQAQDVWPGRVHSRQSCAEGGVLQVSRRPTAIAEPAGALGGLVGGGDVRRQRIHCHWR